MGFQKNLKNLKSDQLNRNYSLSKKLHCIDIYEHANKTPELH